MSGKDNNDDQSQGFVSSSSLKNYAVATGSLTLVINLSLYIYQVITNSKMPTWLLIILALSLSIFYINSFFRRETGVTNSQHIWINFLNALMLFTSISGVNGMLDATHQRLEPKHSVPIQSFIPPKHSLVTTASIGDFLKHLIFPTHAWFNAAEAEQENTRETITFAIHSIDIIQKLTDTLIQQKKNDFITIDSLHKTIDTLEVHYKQAVESLTAAEKILQTNNIPYSMLPLVVKVLPRAETGWQERELLQKAQIQKLQLQQLQLKETSQQLLIRQRN